MPSADAPGRRHSALGCKSPDEFEAAATLAARSLTP